MSDLSDITFDDIETKIMSLLYANTDVSFSQYSLFNKLIEDKFDIKPTTIINQSFKAKFIIVLRNLMSKYDDIKITKDNNVYNVICISDKNDTSRNTKSYPSTEVSINFPDVSDYIIDNNLDDEFRYIDPFEGNTIFHDLVISKNVDKINRLINENKFDFLAKNKFNLTPVEISQDPRVSVLILSKLCEKLIIDNTYLKKDIVELNKRIVVVDDKVEKFIKESKSSGFSNYFKFFGLVLIISFIIGIFQD
jgi:hypothetical protein